MFPKGRIPIAKNTDEGLGDEKITREWEAKLTANYRAKVETEVRNEMYGKLGIPAPAATTATPATTIPAPAKTTTAPATTTTTPATTTTAPATVPTATATKGNEKATDNWDPADLEEEKLYYDESDAF